MRRAVGSKTLISDISIIKWSTIPIIRIVNQSWNLSKSLQLAYIAKRYRPQKIITATATATATAPSFVQKTQVDWIGRKIGGWKINGKMKKREDRKYLIFSCVCLVGGMKKWKNEKLFCLVEKKSRRIKNVIYINWLLYHYYIIDKK